MCLDTTVVLAAREKELDMKYRVCPEVVMILLNN